MMSSVDYDSKKAHEYYMKHRKLKGRHSIKKFSQSQREQFNYAKAQLREERKTSNRLDRETIDKNKSAKLEKIRETRQAQLGQLRERVSGKIDSLRKMLKAMPKEQRIKMQERIKAQIGELKEKKKVSVEKIREKANKDSSNIRKFASESKKQATAKNKADYDAKVDEAYNKIKSGKTNGSKKSNKLRGEKWT